MQIFYFKIPDDVDIVSVEVTSESEKCAIVSIMNVSVSDNSCMSVETIIITHNDPRHIIQCSSVNDLLKNVGNEGIRQTMTSLALLTFQVRKN